MVLTNTKIIELIAKSELISDHNPDHIKNASYSISVGQVFKPETGDEIVLDGCSVGKEKLEHLVSIKPGEIIVIMSKEIITMPLNICASYNPTFLISKQGFSLIKNSIIEPGYKGHVSCIFANFSSSTIKLSKGKPIVKLVFYELASNLDEIDHATMKTQTIETAEYVQQVATMATDFHSSFLNIESLETKILDKAVQKVRSQVTWGGVLIGFLLLFATLQPFLSKWIYKNDIEDSYTLKGALIERLKKLEEDSIYRRKIEVIYDSLTKK